MPRIEREQFVDIDEELLEEFICGICHEIFVDPMVTNCCRQTYCKVCISQWLSTSQRCPNDRRALSIKDLSPPPRNMTNVFNNMKIKCFNERNGCQTIMKISEVETHSKSCDYDICETCGLGKSSSERHDCIQNLKIKIDGIMDQNISLSKENKKLNDEIKRITVENRRLRHESNPLNNVMDGKFKLKSKYKVSGGLETHSSGDLSTTINIVVSGGQDFVLIRSQEGNCLIKRFTLGKRFHWIRDGKHLTSVFEKSSSPSSPSSSTRLTETVDDNGKINYYYYDFNSNELTINWMIGSIQKFEVFTRCLTI